MATYDHKHAEAWLTFRRELETKIDAGLVARVLECARSSLPVHTALLFAHSLPDAVPAEAERPADLADALLPVRSCKPGTVGH